MQVTFTPDQLAGVFLWRWRRNEMTRSILSMLRPNTFLTRVNPNYARDIQRVGDTITIRTPKRA